MLIEYISLRGATDGIDTTVISELASTSSGNCTITSGSYPFVGRTSTTPAPHPRDGLLKNEEIYNAFDTAKILNRYPAPSPTNPARPASSIG